MARPEKIGQSLESIEALIHYLEEASEKPASYGGVRQSVAAQQKKGKYQAHKMTIYNGRPIADQLSLEREGFIFVNHETKMKNFYDENEIRDLYYKETEELVKRTSGAKRVVVFDHTLRSADEAIVKRNRSAGRCATPIMTTPIGPGRSASATYSPTKRKSFSNAALPSSKPGGRSTSPCSGSRWRLPMRAASERRNWSPARGFTRIGSAKPAHMTFNPDHVWYYFPNMQRNEAIVFKTFESERDGRARWTAHCAFDDPTSPPDAPPRESIEMRTLAFF